MKKKIKKFIDRLRDVWSIVRGYNYTLVRYSKNTSAQNAYRTACLFMYVKWIMKSDCADVLPRIEMLQDLLDSDNSVMMLTKDADGRLTYCYDCKSEEDFDDSINMEVK